MRSDVELLRTWQDGDKIAGSALFRRYFDPLFRFFVNKLPEDAEDLIQNTWMACLRYQQSLEKAESFRAYLFTIARHELYRALRRRHPKDEMDFTVTSVIDIAPTPSTLVGLEQRDQGLLTALRSLPVDSQIVLELYYWEELTSGELASVLEVPLGTAKSRLRRAKQLLLAALARPSEPLEGDDLDAWIQSMRQKVGTPSET